MMKKVKIAYNLGTNKSLTTPELNFYLIRSYDQLNLMLCNLKELRLTLNYQ